jgi:chromosome segregation ATPase
MALYSAGSALYTPVADEPQAEERRSTTGPSKRAADAALASNLKTSNRQNAKSATRSSNPVAPVAAQTTGTCETDLAECTVELSDSRKQQRLLEQEKARTESSLQAELKKEKDANARLLECSTQMQKKEYEVAVARSDAQATNDALRKVQQKLTSLESDKTQAESNVQDARKEEARVRALLEECTRRAKRTDGEVDAARSAARATEGTLRTVKQKLEGSERKVAEIQSSLRELETGLREQKKRQWTSLTNELHDAQAKLAQQTLRDGERTRIDAELREIKQKMQSMLAEKEAAKLELTQHASLKSDLDNARREAQMQNQRVASLESVITRQKQQLAEREQQRITETSILRDLETQLQTARATILKNEQDTNELLQKEYSNARDAQNALLLVQQERASLESDKTQAAVSLQEALKEQARVRALLEKCTMQAKKTDDEVAAARSDAQATEATLRTVQQELEGSERKVAEIQSSLRELETGLRDKQTSLMNELADAQAKLAQQSLRDEERTRIDAELREIKQKMESMLAEKEAAITNQASLKLDLDNARGEAQVQTQIVAKLESVVNQQKQQLAEGEERQRNATEMLHDLRAQLQQSQSDMQSKEMQLQNATKRLSEATDQNQTLQEQLADAASGESVQLGLLQLQIENEQVERRNVEQAAHAAQNSAQSQLNEMQQQLRAAADRDASNELEKNAAAQLANEQKLLAMQLESKLTELEQRVDEDSRRANECEALATQRANENATMQATIETLQTELDDKNAERGRDALLAAMRLHGIVYFWRNMEADFESAIRTDFGKMHREQIKEKAEELLVRVIYDLSSKCRLMNMHAIKSSMNPCLQCDELLAHLNPCLQCDDLRMKLAAGRATDIIKAITRHARELDRDMDDSKLLARKASAATFLRMPTSAFTAAVKEISRTALRAFLKGATDTLTGLENHSAFTTDAFTNHEKINKRVCALVLILNTYAHTFEHNPLDCRGATYRQMAHAMASRIYEYLQRLQQLAEKHSLPSFVVHDASASYGFPPSYKDLFEQIQSLNERYDMASLTLDGRVDFVNFFYQRVYPQSKRTPLKRIKLRTSKLSEADVTYSSTSDAWKRIMEAIRMPSLDISTVTLEEFSADCFKMGVELLADTKRMLDSENHHESRFPETQLPFFKGALLDRNGRPYRAATKENIGEILDIRMKILHHRAEKQQQHVASFASEMQKLFPAKEQIWSSVGMSIIRSNADSSWQDTLTTRVTRVTEEGSRPFDRGAIFQNAIDLAISDLSLSRSNTSSVSSAITRLATTLTDRHVFDIDSVRLKYLLQAVIDESKTS